MKRQCAVCSDRNQTNVVMKWMRHEDGQIFHACCHCAERGKVNEFSVHDVTQGQYTTVARRGYK